MDSSAVAPVVTIDCPRCHDPIDVTSLDPGDAVTCPYCTHEFIITRQFGNFLLERQLGSGGMGTVYLGRDVTLNRVVAVKVLKPELVADHKFTATFLREAEITASLNHPNIVQVYTSGQQENTYYLVVELMPGGSLDERIMEHGRVSELEGLEIGIAVARGLECALQRGLIHRDIKPGNILFSNTRTPKVVDFGLSLSQETTDHFGGEIWGTPYYVPPEKLERLPEDFRSDLYSLGATLFHAFAGRPPYEGEDPNEVALKHLTGPLVSLKTFVPGISDQTAYALSRAMARRPEDRFGSYGEFIAQLEDAKRRLTDPAAVGFLEQEAIARVPDNRWLYYGLIAGMVLLFMVLLVVLYLRGAALLKSPTAPTPGMDDYTPRATTH